MAAYFPLTIFYVVIIVFRINITSSHLFAVVYYSQTLAMPLYVRNALFMLSTEFEYLKLLLVKLLFSFVGVWNLDFFRPFYSDLCLGLDILPTLTIDYTIAVYPFLLMAVSYLLIVLYDRNYRVVTVLWRPFQKLSSLLNKELDIRTSVMSSTQITTTPLWPCTMPLTSNISELNTSPMPSWPLL